MDNIGLTARQREVYDYLVSEMDELGVCPSFEMIKDHLGLASKSGVHRIVHALEERGLIRMPTNKKRAIEVIQDAGVTSLMAQNAALRVEISSLSINLAARSKVARELQSEITALRGRISELAMLNGGF